jgi:hypothetical protein
VKQNPKLRGTNAQLRSLTSLNQIEYEELLSIFDSLVVKKLSRFTLKGALRKRKSYQESVRSSLEGSSAKLNFMLMYLKENPNQAYHGYCFGLSQSKVSEWIEFLSPVLEASLIKLGCMPQFGDQFDPNEFEYEYLIIDATEREVPRRTDSQARKEEYSGKKKKYMNKNLAITDQDARVLFLSPTYEGNVHDRAIMAEISIKDFEQSILADLGFLGAEREYENLILPFRKPRKSKNNDPVLRETQIQINQAISSLRVRVEHAFASIKRLKIIREKIRLKSYDMRDLMMRIATAMHNFRLGSRKPIINQS